MINKYVQFIGFMLAVLMAGSSPAQNWDHHRDNRHHHGEYHHDGKYYKYHHGGKYYNYYHRGRYYNYYHNGAFFIYFNNGRYYNECKWTAHGKKICW